MAIKKSELYSTLWASCDALRGGMDASQYKDYVLVLLFVKYISDKYAGQEYAPITIPHGSSFKDMVALIGDKEIGDKINKQILNPIKEANKLSDFPDFNDSDKLGKDKDMVDTLSKLISVFNKPELDFSSNKAEGDDILGDAYEYLMRNFATESGKSKGQFYTPAEVSKVLSKIVGINNFNSTGNTTAYDPTCGSGSLLLKLSDEAEKTISLFGQEKETTTAGLARMNMILHNNPTAEIWANNTLSNPHWVNGESLKTFDYCVANPPFSLKNWTSGVTVGDGDKYKRFDGFGTPPDKNGDYAFLLHIIKSLNSKGKGAIILPHGVLFRGNSEAVIRKNIINKGLIKGIIGLPANLFYGTGIPACIILIDKENSHTRKGIFVMDASKGYIKDGNKNRLRDQDIHKIVDAFNKQIETPKYSKMVSMEEIIKNDYNLNIPRYIDTQESEDTQDILAHLQGGIPTKDIDQLANYWSVYPSLKPTIFEPKNKEYSNLKINQDEVKKAIFQHQEFITFGQSLEKVFVEWKSKTSIELQKLELGCKPKQVIHDISESLLHSYDNRELIDQYDIYQHLMSYWSETLQDDIYAIATGGWEVGNELTRLLNVTKKKDGSETKKAKEGIAGLEGRIIPTGLVIVSYFATEQKAIDDLNTQKEELQTIKTEMEEEHGTEGGIWEDLDKINKVEVTKLIKSKKTEKPQTEELKNEITICQNYLDTIEKEASITAKLKTFNKELETKIIAKYPTLTIPEIQKLVITEKWMATLEKEVKTEMDRISQTLTGRIKELAERYAKPMPIIAQELQTQEQKVQAHLTKMGFVTI
jgi:type I restriction enzyme M protein